MIKHINIKRTCNNSWIFQKQLRTYVPTYLPKSGQRENIYPAINKEKFKEKTMTESKYYHAHLSILF